MMCDCKNRWQQRTFRIALARIGTIATGARSFFFWRRTNMADGSSGGIGILGVIIGAIIVVGIGFFFLNGSPKGGGGTTTGSSISVPAPKAK
jgi:hypothetical protein